MRHTYLAPLCALLVASIATASTASPPGKAKEAVLSLPELNQRARILRDVDGMPHIYAYDEHDAVFLQGWVTAQDRLFQIDVLRRQASGTLAELLGVGPGNAVLRSDIELRTIGLRRAAERSMTAYSDEMRDALEAYADGVNAYVQRHPLPAQYAALQLTKFEPWTALDSAIIGKALAFQLSFDIDTGATQNFQAYQAALGPALAQAMFFGDVFRAAPFDPAASVPDATDAAPFLGALKAGAARAARGSKGATGPAVGAPALDATALGALRDLRKRYDAVPLLRTTLNRTELQIGSNEWAVAGWLTKDGRPLVANDPHLSLDLPANFHQVHLVAKKGGLDAIGSAVAGAPFVVLGQNRRVTWGETTTGFDVTDTYLEQLVPDASSPSGLSSLYMGNSST
jgi:penicillin G amidase